MSFRVKLFLLVSTITVGVTVLAIVVVNFVFQRRLIDAVEVEIGYVHERFDRFLSSSIENLISVGVIVSDDARFRGSLSTGDIPTIYQATESAAQRYNTSLFMVLDNSGKMLVKAGTPGHWHASFGNLPVISDAINGYDSGDIWQFENSLFIVAAVPIRVGDNQLGILILGQDFNDGVIASFADLTGLNVAFFGRKSIFTSTLDSADINMFRGKIVQLRQQGELSSRFVPSIPLPSSGKPSEAGPSPILGLSFNSHRQLGALFDLNDISSKELATGVIFRSLDPELHILKRIRGVLLWIGSGAILVAMVLTYMLARSVSRPIQR